MSGKKYEDKVEELAGITASDPEFFNEWETEFTLSMWERVKKYKTLRLSDKQAACIDKIWEKYLKR